MAPARRPSRPLALAAAVAVVAGFGAPHAALAQESAPAPDAPEVSSAVADLSQPATTAEDARWNAARDALAATSADDPFYLPPTTVPATGLWKLPTLTNRAPSIGLTTLSRT